MRVTGIGTALVIATALPIATSAHAQDEPMDRGQAAQAAAKAFIMATSRGRDARQVPRLDAPPSHAGEAGPSLGLAFTITGAGAQIIAIMPGSPAAAAGLSPGRLITRVNGTALAQLSPDAVVALLRSPTRAFTVEVAGGATVTLLRPTG